MKRFLATLILVVGFAYLLWHRLRIEPVPQEAAVAAPTAPPVPEASPPPLDPAAPKISVAPAAESVDTPEKRGLVEFRLVNGLAIAYGDVLLGKPRQGDTMSRGFYDMPPPQLWERPEIAYAINPELPNPQRVTDAVEFFNRVTPVRFVPFSGQRDAIVFEPGEEHCYSYLGRIGGNQPIKLSPGCGSAEIIHEIMHALGFIHEQSRTDRDQHVDINWTNIDDKYRNQFAIVPDALMAAVGDTPFDFKSTMLYRADTFASKPGTPTMIPKPGRPSIEPMQGGLSQGDIDRLKRLYQPY